MFMVAKIVGYFVQPSNFIALLAVLVAPGTLENRFPVPRLDSPVTGLILLGGAVDTHISAERGQNTTNDAGERITAVAELNRRFPDARIVLSGGANHILTAQPLSESAVARRLLINLGADVKRIEMEEVSRDTCENAEESLALAKPQANESWLLVTSASHMPRAVACFRAIGFAIIPYPVDYRTQGTEGVLTCLRRAWLTDLLPQTLQCMNG